MSEKTSQISQEAQGFQPRHPACVTMPPGGSQAVALAKSIYLTASGTEDFKAVASRMYRALCGVEVNVFPRRKGFVGGLRRARA
jgi:hypothetical protein